MARGRCRGRRSGSSSHSDTAPAVLRCTTVELKPFAYASLCVPTTTVLSYAALFLRSCPSRSDGAVEEILDAAEIGFERVVVDLGVLGHGDQHRVARIAPEGVVPDDGAVADLVDNPVASVVLHAVAFNECRRVLLVSYQMPSPKL